MGCQRMPLATLAAMLPAGYSPRPLGCQGQVQPDPARSERVELSAWVSARPRIESLDVLKGVLIIRVVGHMHLLVRRARPVWADVCLLMAGMVFWSLHGLDQVVPYGNTGYDGATAWALFQCS